MFQYLIGLNIFSIICILGICSTNNLLFINSNFINSINYNNSEIIQIFDNKILMSKNYTESNIYIYKNNIKNINDIKFFIYDDNFPVKNYANECIYINLLLIIILMIFILFYIIELEITKKLQLKNFFIKTFNNQYYTSQFNRNYGTMVII